MNRKRAAAALLAGAILLWSGCDTGLGPVNEPAGFSGTIRFKNWPPADSVREVRIVAFEKFPADSAGVFLALLNYKAALYPPDLSSRGSLPKFVDTVSYRFSTRASEGLNLKVQQYEYVVVAVQYGPNVLTDWNPVGVYTMHPGTFEPAPLRVLLHRITPHIDFDVDFHNLPPKPWR
jgi:hypothetical protein